jgi:hypothetical protein
MNWLSLTTEELQSLKKTYEKKRAEGLSDTDAFTWRGHDWLMAYVRHGLSFMETEGEASRARALEVMRKARDGELVD